MSNRKTLIWAYNMETGRQTRVAKVSDILLPWVPGRVPLRNTKCNDCGIELSDRKLSPCLDKVLRCKDCGSFVWTLKQYGMTLEDFQKLSDKQGSKCAICKELPKDGQRLCVDHDHSTGKVRGLLCRSCNLLLGNLKDKLANARAVVSYLLRHDGRRSWDHYFLDIAEATATRSKDTSAQVGAVLVRDRQVLATGYNGFPSGVNDAVPERHERPAKYMWTVHAEVNAILQAGKHGISTDKATLYVNPLSPCLNCAKAIVQAGVREVVCPNPGSLGTGDAAVELGKALELLAAAKVLIRKPD